MRMFSSIFLLLTLSFVQLTPAFGGMPSGSDVEELTYDQILDRLSKKKSDLKKVAHSSFDDIKIHAALGYVTSYSKMEIQGSNKDQNHHGLQLSLGIDLFSPRWFSEANWRNFGYQNLGSIEVGLRELDFQVGYQNLIASSTQYRIALGLATRFLNYGDHGNNLHISETTPALAICVGLSSEISSFISAGLQSSYRSPLTSSSDKGGLDIGMQMMASF